MQPSNWKINLNFNAMNIFFHEFGVNLKYEHASRCRKQRVLCIIFISINIKMKKGIINGTHYTPDVSQISTAWTGYASQKKNINKILQSIQNRAMCYVHWKKREERMNYRNNNTDAPASTDWWWSFERIKLDTHIFASSSHTFIMCNICFVW